MQDFRLADLRARAVYKPVYEPFTSGRTPGPRYGRRSRPFASSSFFTDPFSASHCSMLLFGSLSPGDDLGRFGEHYLFDVAECDDLDRLDLDEPQEIALAVPTAADEADASRLPLVGDVSIYEGCHGLERGRPCRRAGEAAAPACNNVRRRMVEILN